MKMLEQLGMLRKVGSSMIKGMLNSDEANFIKVAIKESEKGKKVSQMLGTVSDMLPEKLKIECVNYKHWCLNYYYITKMALSAPLPVIEGMLKYTWIYDLLKANSMVNFYVEGRSGANLKQTQAQLTYVVKGICDQLQYALVNPDKVVIKQNMVPSEILIAMGLHFTMPELAATVLPKTDQFAGNRYLDAAENCGVPVDTCGLPKFAAGTALVNQVPQGQCIIASNLPCEGGMSSYEAIQRSLGNIPIYRLSVPYDFTNPESEAMFAEDLKGMIKFLEETTGKKMDWDKLREVCGKYNELVDMEIERWDLVKASVPPLTNDAIWFPHYWGFNVDAGEDKINEHYRNLLKIAKEAYAKGIPAFPNMRYRTVIWNPPPSGYGHMWNWLERCWGIGALMDLETYGPLEHINTTTPDTMLQGLGKRYMRATMAKHTRGKAENFTNDLWTIVEQFKPDFIIYPSHVGCKNSISMEGILRDECKKRDIPLCIFHYELCDNRVTSRQAMREQVNKFMSDVMHAEPLDESLLVIDDGNGW